MAEQEEEFVGGMTKLKKRVATIRANLGLPPLVNEIGKLLFDRTMDRFDRQVDPDGNPWKPLSQTTLRIRSAQGYPELPALNRSGQLRAAIQLIKTKVDSGTLYINTGAGVRIGVKNDGTSYVRASPHGKPVTIAEVAHYMQKGTPNAPARRFLGIGRLDVKAVDSLLRRKAAAAMEK